MPPPALARLVPDLRHVSVDYFVPATGISESASVCGDAKLSSFVACVPCVKNVTSHLHYCERRNACMLMFKKAVFMHLLASVHVSTRVLSTRIAWHSLCI